MLNVKKATAIMLGLMLIISSVNIHNHVYADNINNTVFYDNKIKSYVPTDVKAEYLDSKIKVEQKKNNNIKNQKSLELRKKFNLFNFIFDMVSISGLSLIWFFKVNRKDKKIIGILAKKGKNK